MHGFTDTTYHFHLEGIVHLNFHNSWAAEHSWIPSWKPCPSLLQRPFAQSPDLWIILWSPHLLWTIEWYTVFHFLCSTTVGTALVFCSLLSSLCWVSWPPLLGLLASFLACYKPLPSGTTFLLKDLHGFALHKWTQLLSVDTACVS